MYRTMDNNDTVILDRTQDELLHAGVPLFNGTKAGKTMLRKKKARMMRSAKKDALDEAQ